MKTMLIVSLILISSIFMLGCVDESTNEEVNMNNVPTDLPNDNLGDLDMLIFTMEVTYVDGSTEVIDRVIDWARMSIVLDEPSSVHYKRLDDNDYGEIVIIHNVMTTEKLSHETITLKDITLSHVESYRTVIVTEENTQY